MKEGLPTSVIVIKIAVVEMMQRERPAQSNFASAFHIDLGSLISIVKIIESPPPIMWRPMLR